jgi:3-oxoadipate enol-lactonase
MADDVAGLASALGWDRLNQIASPTLVFAGHYDGGCPYELVQTMARQIPGARFELLESGHGDWFFDPRAWEIILDFLQA